MTYLRFWPKSIPSTSTIHQQTRKFIVFASVFFAAIAVFAQQPQTSPQQTSADRLPTAGETVTLPAGTQMALVLTHPVQSRVLHRGDDIYAQITSPVNSGSEVVIPPGTFVQGIIDKLDNSHGRGELRLQSMSITFPDGYVAPISGPVTLESSPGYALKDPGGRRAVAAFALPAAGAGLGALIGHSVGKAQTEITSPFPPGCVGVLPFCTTTTTPVFGTKAKDAIIGAGIGSAIGAVASLTLLFGSRHFFLDVGSPVEMTLQQPITLKQSEVAAAVEQSIQHPVAEQPIAQRPMPPPADAPVDRGTCYTPETPGTPPTVIPGAPGPDGVPGPPTIIPGTPPTPGTPYPCP